MEYSHYKYKMVMRESYLYNGIYCVRKTTSLCWDDPLARWHHQMETVSALLAHCEGNSWVISEFPSERASNADFDKHKLLNKWLNDWWFETAWRSCDIIVMDLRKHDIVPLSPIMRQPRKLHWRHEKNIIITCALICIYNVVWWYISTLGV